MKVCISILPFLQSFILLNTILFSQPSPLIRLEEPQPPGEPYEAQTQFKGVASSVDIRVFPSNNYQSEVSIAINPLNLNDLLIGANVLVPGGFRQGYYYSFDGGLSWSGNDILPGVETSTDPAVAFDVNENAYFNFLEFIGGVFYLRVKKSTDGGITWTNSIDIPSPGNADKNHMTTDITNSQFRNNLYVAWTDFYNYNNGGNPNNPIKFSLSTDGGSNFLNPVVISLGAATFFEQGINLAVGPKGEVYATWAINDDWPLYVSNRCDPIYEFGSDGIGFAKSTDGGVNWFPPVRIFDIQGSRDWWCDKNPDSANSPIRMNDFPCMAVDKSGGIWNGTIYITWGAKGTGGDRADIHFSKSTDGGTNWSTAVRINDDNTPNDQWFPWITVDPYGVITIIFYDSRNDPNNQLTEVWVAQSSDGGENFTNFRVSDIAFTPYPILPGNAIGYMGDYLGITSKAGKAYPCWMDNRNAGIYQIYTDIIDTYQEGLLALAHSNRSLDNNATFSNASRHLAKGAGFLHEVFASGGEIFYRRSPDSGQRWDTSVRMTTPSQEGENRNPCITFIPPQGLEPPTLSLIWEKQISDSEYEVWYSKSAAGIINWSEPVLLAVVNTSTWQAGAMPVLSYMDYPGWKRVVAVYCSDLGLYYRVSDNLGSSWSNPALIFNHDRVGYPSLSTGGNFLSLVYDLRDDRKGLHSRIFDGTGWSSAALPADMINTLYNRTPSVTVDPNGDILAAWLGQLYDGNLDPYSSILFRRGFSNNTWDNWFVVFDHPSGVSYTSPAIAYYYLPGFDIPGVEIIHAATANEIFRLKYDGVNWHKFEISSSGQWPNITEETITTGNPIYCWTEQEGPPYSIPVMSGGGEETLNLGIVSNSNPTMNPLENASLLHQRRAVIRHQPTGAFLLLDINPIIITNVTGEASFLPFKSHSISQPVNISLQNIGEYLGSDTLTLPSDVQDLQWNWSATITTDQDTSGNGLPNIFTGNYQVLLRIKDVANPAISTTVNITSLPQLTLNIQNFASRQVIIKPEVQLMNLPVANLDLGAGDVYSSGPTASSHRTALTGEIKEATSKIFMLESSFPNPFNPSTTIRYQVAKESRVSLIVYNLLGQKVRTLVDGFLSPGNYQIVWEGRNDRGEEVGSGMYFLKMVVSSGDAYFTATRKLILMK